MQKSNSKKCVSTSGWGTSTRSNVKIISLVLKMRIKKWDDYKRTWFSPNLSFVWDMLMYEGGP